MVADALSLLRLGVAVAYPSSLHGGGWLPLALFTVAAVTDYVDGPIARRAAHPTRHGGVLDNLADVAFVLGGTAAGVAAGLLPWMVPVSIVLSVGAYLVASLRLSTGAPGPRLARSRIGHAAGVANYAIVGLTAGAVALPWGGWHGVLALASVGTVALNVSAVVMRGVSSTAGAAHASRG